MIRLLVICAIAFAGAALAVLASDDDAPMVTGGPLPAPQARCVQGSANYPACAFSDPNFKAGQRPGGLDPHGYEKPTPTANAK